ncbi:MAG TPA: hypothetical protein VN132_08290, partial [Bdellovibrio sp.]|nr:hypothetical protein [Bdellovibrio sp.]
MMSKLSTTIGLAALLMTNQVFAQSQVDIKKQAGDLKVQFCDLALAPKTFVGFQVGENGLIQKEILGENHCVTKTYGSGLMVEGKKIVIHKMSKSDDESQGKLYEGILKETSSSSSDTSAGTSTSTFNDVKYEVTTLENRDGDVYKIQIKVCHPKFKVADAVSVTNRATLSANKEVSKYTNVGRDKCFTTEYTKGEIQDGDIIGIGLYSVEKPFEVTLIGVPWKRSAAATPGSS